MFTGNVIWGGDNTDKHPLMISLAGNVFFTSFCWTSGQFDMINKTAVCHPGYQPFTNGPPGKKYNFYQPMAHGANIQKKSPWAFYPLSELPNTPFRIPDLAPISSMSSVSTIYTAVNLGLYG